jgi:rfaE bifunctional protein nucleotidyltransferase chain/domain
VEKVVLTNGCFDVLHYGHVLFLREARALGDKLIVGINHDSTITKLKGPHRPIHPLHYRMEVLSELKSVDLVVPFKEETANELIWEIQPDIYVKGGDYKNTPIPELNVIEELGIEYQTLSYLSGLSTTNTLRRNPMTRKDFQLIADTLTIAVPNPIERERAAIVFADALSFTNDRFDRVRFINACRQKGTAILLKERSND